MKTVNDLVSIIIPTYNSEKYLRECLDSIVFQTYKNIEIIIVDGESTDGTIEIINEYNKKYNNIYFLKSNKGVSKQRNVGIEASNGNFVTFIDSDDFVDPSYIDEMYHFLKTNKLDIVCAAICLMYYRNDKLIRKTDLHSSCLSPLNPGNFFVDGYQSCNHSPIKLYKKDIINLIRFDENLIYGEDTAFNYTISKNRTLNIGIAKNAKYFYRKDLATTPAEKRYSKGSLRIFDWLIKVLKINRNNKANKEGILKIMKDNYFVFYDACRKKNKLYTPLILFRVRFILVKNIKGKKEKIILLFTRLIKIVKKCCRNN